MRETMELFVQFGKTRDRDPAYSEVQAQVKHLQEFFCENFYSYNIRARVYRNRRIGDFLKELKLIEGRNTGFPYAIKALNENGSGLLWFDMDDQRGYLSVTIPVHSYFVASDKKSEKSAPMRI